MISWCLRVVRALGNMFAAATRDPLGAFTCIVLAPFRSWKHILQTLFVTLLSAIVLDLLFLWLESFVVPHGTRNKLLDIVLGVVLLGVVAAVFLRQIATPLLNHFDYGGNGGTHGTARFASQAEVNTLIRPGEGLLIGREGPGGKIMRYDGPAHLLTMAPTRSGKGVGTIIPNLLLQKSFRDLYRPQGRECPHYDACPIGLWSRSYPRSIRYHRRALRRL